MTGRYAITGARIFDGDGWHDNHALVVDGEQIEAIAPLTAVAPGLKRVDLDGGVLAPGFVDLQVNGGGGVMLNSRQDVDAIATICRAHARFGTTALLPTLITDTPEITEATVEAGADAARAGVPGFLGLHLEGPHLSVARKGAHDPKLIRPMQEADRAFLVSARARLPHLLTTVAPESASAGQIAVLSAAGLIVSLGHSDTGFAQASACAQAGARMVTHLFNAMSQLGNREPGMVGAALATGSLFAGLIADGIHVDAATIAIALRAKQEPGRVFLVTDAMATIGTGMTEFSLNGRTVYRRDGSLRLADGTLAGADLDMISAVRFMHLTVGLELAEALRMASLYPAMAMRIDATHGRFGDGTRADIVHLSETLDVRSVRIGGGLAFEASA
ncbi:MAG: N-acetylglucosamine-6-phosphate deacetylase [Rhizobiaceae bacterium]